MSNSKTPDTELAEIIETLGDICHAHYKGCTSDEYSYDTEVIYMLNTPEALAALTAWKDRAMLRQRAYDQRLIVTEMNKPQQPDVREQIIEILQRPDRVGKPLYIIPEGMVEQLEALLADQQRQLLDRLMEQQIPVMALSFRKPHLSL